MHSHNSGFSNNIRNPNCDLDWYKALSNQARLGIAANADQTVIKQAFRALCLIHHPDKQGVGRQGKSDHFVLLHEAYQQLLEGKHGVGSAAAQEAPLDEWQFPKNSNPQPSDRIINLGLMGGSKNVEEMLFLLMDNLRKAVSNFRVTMNLDMLRIRTIINDNPINLNLFVPAAMYRYSDLTPKYLNSTQGSLLVYNDEASLKVLTSWVRSLATGTADLCTIVYIAEPVVPAGNLALACSDLPHPHLLGSPPKSPDALVQAGAELAKKYKCHFDFVPNVSPQQFFYMTLMAYLNRLAPLQNRQFQKPPRPALAIESADADAGWDDCAILPAPPSAAAAAAPPKKRG